MARKQEIDVAVVGAGPVGLCTALALRDARVGVAVYDTNRRTGVHSYATVLHPETLGLIDRYGLGEACREHGRILQKIGLYEGVQRRGEIDFSRLPGAHPHVLILPQSRLEGILEEALASRGVAVHWEHRAQALEEVSGGAELVVAKLETVSTGYPIARTERVVDRTFDVKAQFVVGADGYDSFVRRRLEVETVPAGDAEMVSVYQCEVRGELPEEGRFLFADDGVTAFWPLAEGRCRFSFPIAAAADHRPDEAGLAAHLASRAPWFEAEVRSIEWTSHALFERRLATSFGSGRIWMAGDAAHLASPVGAQSMNVGLREAVDLAERIAAAIGGGKDGTLARYGEERSAEWRRLLGIDAELRGAAGTWATSRAARILPSIPASGDDLEALAGTLGLKLVAK